MNTTELSAELLITGTGVVIWIVFLIAAIFGISIQDIITNTNVFTLAPLLGIAYVFGILIDRLGFGLFHSIETRIQEEIIKDKSTTPSVMDKDKFVLINSKELGFQLNYNRSRLRICRSWSLNFFLIAIASGIWANAIKLSYPFFAPLLSLVFAITSALTWRTLAKDYYTSVQSTYDFLIEHEKQKK